MSTGRSDITAVLEDLRKGDEGAFEALLVLLYKDLRRIAGSYQRAQRPDHTLQPTALVHEAYLRLVGHQDVRWESRAHFLNAAAQVMRRILVDHARARRADRRGGADVRVVLDEAIVEAPERDLDLVALDDALTKLAKAAPRLSRVIELRYFGGLTTKEVAEVLDVSITTVEREWVAARAWLRVELGASPRQTGQ
jgi:RNA polymerase sigma-70 factor, ECF subfamily